MLPQKNRLRSSSDIRAVFKGVTAGSDSVVVHICARQDVIAAVPGPRIAVVCSKKTGNSVVRHTMARRLRHAAGEILSEIPPHLDIAIRARPAIAEVPGAVLRAETIRTLRRALAKAARSEKTVQTPTALRSGKETGRSRRSGAREKAPNTHGTPAEETTPPLPNPGAHEIARSGNLSRDGRGGKSRETSRSSTTVRCSASGDVVRGGALVGTTLYVQHPSTVVSRETTAKR